METGFRIDGMRKSSDSISDEDSKEVLGDEGAAKEQSRTLVRPAFFVGLIFLGVNFLVIGMMTGKFLRQPSFDEVVVSKPAELRSLPIEEDTESQDSRVFPRQQAILIFYRMDTIDQTSVVESGFFEPRLIFEALDDEELADLVDREGVSIVIDGRVGEIRHEDGRFVPLPVGEEIQEAVLQLLEEKPAELDPASII